MDSGVGGLAIILRPPHLNTSTLERNRKPRSWLQGQSRAGASIVAPDGWFPPTQVGCSTLRVNGSYVARINGSYARCCACRPRALDRVSYPSESLRECGLPVKAESGQELPCAVQETNVDNVGHFDLKRQAVSLQPSVRLRLGSSRVP
jgi:hypothetical protein